jgi:hypothetical protein
LVELGENNNSYFWGLEEQRQVKKSMSKLLDENNKVIKEQGEILNTIKDYYPSNPGDLFNFMFPTSPSQSNFSLSFKILSNFVSKIYSFVENSSVFFDVISLLNVDLKLISHVLAQRLKNVLPKIINVDQTGYVKNRFIGFNLRQIQDRH